MEKRQLPATELEANTPLNKLKKIIGKPRPSSPPEREGEDDDTNDDLVELRGD